MPLVKREIEPVYLSRGLITPQGVSNELECVTNCTLSAIIRQLSNLGKHAEDIFGELYNEANLLYKRSNMLQDRIDRLSVKVTQLDATRDQVSLQDIQMRKAFKSSFLLDQEVVASHTLPSAMRDTYMRCEKPPKLSILTPYRDDGKEALKFYTNPKYFFELWCQEMQKNITDIREKRRGKKRRGGHRTQQTSGPRAVRTRKDQWQQQAMGKDLMPVHSNYSPTQTPTSEGGHMIMSDTTSSQGSMSNMNHQMQQQMVSQEEYRDPKRYPSHRPQARPPPPPSNESTPTDEERPIVNGSIHHPARPAPAPPEYQQQNYGQNMYQNHLPPAPPQPMMTMTQDQMGGQHGHQFPLPPDPMEFSQGNHIPMPPPLPPGNMSPYHNSDHPQHIPPPPPMPQANIPPAPPPPPGPSGGIPIPPAPPGPPDANIPAPPPLPPPGGFPSQPPPLSSTPPTDPISSSPPSNAISPTRRQSQRPTPPRETDGRSDLLKAIQKGINLRKVEVKQEKERTAMPNSVEAILARRIAVELSDSEDGESYSGSEGGGDWSD
ncbi:uncharacterized protein [Amphiura filiformis]|uniref:uncharacterized protein isoform X1 n=1 Tax=Amphiura filiformis TaxID=82378 RepID=UPI003B213067